MKYKQCYGATRPSVAPWIVRAEEAVASVPKTNESVAPLWVDHKMLTMLWSHEALRGFMCFPSSRRCTCTIFFENSFKRKDPYGSTIKCTPMEHKRAKCYGATDASMAPWFHHPGLAPLGTAFAYEAKAPPLWVDHKTRKKLWSHRALHGSMGSPPLSGVIWYSIRL